MVRSLLCAILAAASLHAADIRGTVVIERKLTKRNVTLSAGLYQRGTAVSLAEDALSDPLGFERTHTVVYLEGDIAAEPITEKMEQRDRRFAPDLLVIPAGSSVSFPNFDPVFHNVFSLSKTKNFDLGNYPKGQSRLIKFSAAGIVSVFCHLHSNMAATIFVAPNRWYTRPDPNGQFTIPNLPPGRYTVVAWHKSGGTFKQTIDVGAQGVDGLRFVIPLPAEGPTQTTARR